MEQVSISSFHGDDDIYVPQTRTTNTYNAFGVLINTFTEKYENGSYVNTRNKAWHYNAFGDLDSLSESKFVKGNWEVQEKTIYRNKYDADHKLTETIKPEFELDDDNRPALKNRLRIVYTYGTHRLKLNRTKTEQRKRKAAMNTAITG
ncbi:MAG: hypothetical protein V4543_03770 [Bacteroidota bacterium]